MRTSAKTIQAQNVPQTVKFGKHVIRAAKKKMPNAKKSVIGRVIAIIIASIFTTKMFMMERIKAHVSKNFKNVK